MNPLRPERLFDRLCGHKSAPRVAETTGGQADHHGRVIDVTHDTWLESFWAKVDKTNARKTHCKNGHEFTPENTRQYTDGHGRQCIQCRKERHARENAARRVNPAAVAPSREASFQ